jgi:pyruvate/2-oxoglutarate dehydrogenase complex dihydrolipoamide dehydrogenase (E3) component
MIDPRLDLSPADEHNIELVANVHPSDWSNPSPESRYNLVVVGGGTAGLVAAAGAGGMGAKVALVERGLLGGDCLNVGCVPSKAIIRSGRAVAEIRDAGEVGVRVAGEIAVDFPAVMERMRRVRAHISPHDSAWRFSEHYNVDVFFGDARFIGPDCLDVAGTALRFSKAVVATGARAAVPPIPGLEEAGFLTNHTVFNLTRQPERLAVIGGGPIGTELAQTFARLGTDVTLVEMGPQFLPREDREAVEILTTALARDGVDIMLESTLAEVEAADGGKRLTLQSPAGRNTIVVDEILVAVGRTPNVDGLGLENAGVTFDHSGIRIDDTFRTSNRRIYASGDVCLATKFTHAADAASRAVLQNALFPGPKKRLSDLVIPWCTYTDPEIAHVGLYPEEAESRGVEISTIEVAMDSVDRALAEGHTEGFLKVHLKRGSDTILGATIVGRHAGDLISEITAAMVARRGLGWFSGVIHPYPTHAEIIRKAADASNRTRLTPRTRSLLDRWFRWTR